MVIEMADFSPSTIEPFNVGRSSYRLLFDFGVMLSSFSSSSNKRVLDFGAGTGWISEFLNRMGYVVYSLDIDPGMPGSIKSRVLADKRINPGKIFPIIGSGMALPFPDGFFSHVCCFDTLHHMDNYPRTFKELFRVLSTDGRAIFIEPGARHSRSEETIKFIQTYKKDDPTWIERDVVLEEINLIARESGFSRLVMQPTILPGLRKYSISEWEKFRQGDPSLAEDYLSLLKDFNYNDHLSFYCEKLDIKEAVKEVGVSVSSEANVINSLSDMKIAVDLTPMLPGGENGGAKLMTLELIRAMANLLPHTKFLLLTAESSHSELDDMTLHFSNIERLCVLHNSIPQSVVQPVPFQSTWNEKAKDHLKAIARKILPFSIKLRIKRCIHHTQPIPGSFKLLRQVGADLLFCPFTAPFYADGQVPTVSVIYDLQYRAYPDFFAPEDLFQREEAFKTAYQKADHLVAISEYVRGTVIEASSLSPQQVSAVPIGLFRSFKEIDDKDICISLLSHYNLTEREFFLYPANFWEHKNHAMLLTAFGMYFHAHPDSRLKLVCTGAPGRSADNFCNMVKRMGLTDKVIYPGFVSTIEYEALLNAALALVFPSLYEGFGIPVLEAMAAGIPVMCSNVTSLPEVGGDAVLYFNPRKPVEMVSMLERLIDEPGLREALIANGLQRADYFSGADRMAKQYIAIFEKVLLGYLGDYKDALLGIYADGWTADMIKVRFSSAKEGRLRTLSINLENQNWIKNKVKVEVSCRGVALIGSVSINPGQKTRLNIPLPEMGGALEVKIGPTFNPMQLGLSEDSRDLGLRCPRCEIIDHTGHVNLLGKG